MKWQIKAEIAGKTGRKTTIELPISDDGMARALCRLLQGPLDTQVTITDIEPQELASLCGEGRDLDELNYLAKRMDGLWGTETGRFLAVMEADHPDSIRDAINIICNIDCYSLVDDGKSLSEIGRRFILDRDGAMPMEDFRNGDFSDVGQQLLDSGEGRKTAHGMLYPTGYQFNTEYIGTTFPEYHYDSSVIDILLGHGENIEVIQLPCDDLVIEKALRRLGADSLDECRIDRVEGQPDPCDLIDSLCPDPEGNDLRKLNLFANICRSFEPDDYKKLDAAMKYAGRSDLDSAITITHKLDSFRFVPGVTEELSLGEYLIKDTKEFNYHEDLEDYIDYERFGRDLVRFEEGEFIEDYGYVGICEDTTLDEIMGQNEDGGMTMI